MFRTWLQNNRLQDYDFSYRLFPPASDREYWESITTAQLVQDGEKYLDYPWPIVRGTYYRDFLADGKKRESDHFERRSALLNLFFAELSEYSGRFLPQICDGIFAICEETFWGIPTHLRVLKQDELLPKADEPYIDLFSGETIALLSMIYHLFAEELNAYCPGIGQRIAHELKKRAVDAYLNHTEYPWMGYKSKPNNWNPWILSNLVTAFLVCDIDNDKRIAGLEKMFREVNHYYNTIPADGGCEEGASYWLMSFVKLHEFCHHLYTATGGAVNFYTDPLLRKAGQYGLHVYLTDNYFCTFSDGHPLLAERCAPYTIFGFGKMLDEPKLCSLAATLYRAQQKNLPQINKPPRVWFSMYSLLYGKEITTQPDFIPESRYVLPVIQNAFMRKNDWYFGLKGGSTAWSHSHLDIGNFVAYHQGKPVLIDSGAGEYSAKTFSKNRYDIWTMRSGWHNLPVFNGIEQAHGEQYCADGFEAGVHSASVSFAKAYPKEAFILKALRTVNIAEDGIAAEDRFVFDREDNLVSEHFISVLKPEITEKGVLLGNTYLLTMNVPFTASVEYMPFDGDPKLTGTWQTDGLYRICLDFTCNKTATVKILLQKVI